MLCCRTSSNLKGDHQGSFHNVLKSLPFPSSVAVSNQVPRNWMLRFIPEFFKGYAQFSVPLQWVPLRGIRVKPLQSRSSDASDTKLLSCYNVTESAWKWMLLKEQDGQHLSLTTQLLYEGKVMNLLARIQKQTNQHSYNSVELCEYINSYWETLGGNPRR